MRWNDYGNSKHLCCYSNTLHHHVLLGLSKWVRQLVKHHDSFTSAMQSLVSFSECQQGVVRNETVGPSPTVSGTRSAAHLSPHDPQVSPKCQSNEVQADVPFVNSPPESGMWCGDGNVNKFNDLLLIC